MLGYEYLPEGRNLYISLGIVQYRVGMAGVRL